MIYNLTSLTEANSTLQYMGEVTELVPWFAVGFVIATMAVILLSLQSKNIGAMFAVAGFFTTVITGLMWLAGFISFNVWVFPMVITVVASFAMAIGGD